MELYGEKSVPNSDTHAFVSVIQLVFDLPAPKFMTGWCDVCLWGGGSTVFIITYYTSWNCQIPTEKCSVDNKNVSKAPFERRTSGRGWIYFNICTDPRALAKISIILCKMHSWWSPNHRYTNFQRSPSIRSRDTEKGGAHVRTCTRLINYLCFN